MDENFPFLYEILYNTIDEFRRTMENLRETPFDSNCIHYKRLFRLLHIFAPVLIIVLFYQYIKYLLIFNAYQYEEYVKKRKIHFRRVSKQLRVLAKRYESIYFCYMPMNHGTTLPPTYSLFMAIKEVLSNANRPATQIMRTNLLMELLKGDSVEKRADTEYMELTERDLFDSAPNEVDPLSEYNLDIMNCSRELIIHGVKDFDVMSTVYRVMETVDEDFD